MRTVWILGALMLGFAATPSCAGKAESTDDKLDGGAGGSSGDGSGGAAAGGSAGEGGSFGGSGPGGYGGQPGWGGYAGTGGGFGGASGWAGGGGSGPGGSGPCGGHEACPGNIPAIICSGDYKVTLTCNIGDACPASTICQQYCPSCMCHVAPPMSGNLLAGCDRCMSDTDCGPGLACKEDPALQGSGAKACVMK